MKNNNENWHNFINESYLYPDGLTEVEKRFQARVIRKKKNQRILISSFSAIAASLLFIVLVNTNTTFASTVSEIPLIGKLAEIVSFDKGLTNTINNEYVQEVNLTAWSNQNKLLLPYVIADERNLVLFFQLPEDYILEPNYYLSIVLNHMIDTTSGEQVSGFGYTSANITNDAIKENHGLIMQNYHFSDRNLPQSISIEVELYKRIIDATSIDESNNLDTKEENTLKTLGESIGTFQFDIAFNEFKKPITYNINENLTILEQQITVEEMKVYPTGTEITFTFSDDNTAWIKGLELEVEQSDGSILKGKSGISGSHDTDNKWMKVFIESNYFQDPKEQSLVINGIRLLDKDEEYIIVDLDHKTLTPEINDITLDEVVRRGNQVDLVFLIKTTTNDHFSMFSLQYKDLKGNSYEMNSQGSTMIGENLESHFTVEYPIDGKVILQRLMTPKIVLDEPIVIKLP